jgi:cell division protein FtsQ
MIWNNRGFTGLNRTEVKKPQGISGWGFGLTLAGLLLIIGGFIIFQSNIFLLRHIEISGNRLLAKEEILDRLGLKHRVNLWQTDPEGLARNLLKLPAIRRVTVERKFPDTLIIQVVEREPLCLVDSPKGLLELDEAGVILSVGRTEAAGTLPVLTGLKGFQLVPGLPGRIQHVLYPEGVKLLLAAGADLRQEISQVDVGHFRVYTVDSIQVEFGDTTNLPEKMATLRALLARSDRRRMVEIDLRAPAQPVIRTANDHLSG